MAFGLDKEQKKIGTAIIAVMAALVVFELGKTLGMLLVQFSLPLFMPALFSGSEAAAEELLSKPMMGVTLQEVMGSILSLIMQATGGLCCWAVWRKNLLWYRNRGVGLAEQGVSRPEWQRWILFCATAMLGCLGLNLVMNGLQITLFSEEFMKVAQEQASVPVIFGVLMYGIVSPMAEEIVFRGVIYGKMRKAIGASAALPLASLFFAIYHGNIIQGIYAAVIGAVLCYVYEKSGNLWVAVSFHGMGNLIVYLLIGAGDLMGVLGNAAACVLGVILTALAAGAFYLCYGKPKLS